MSSETISSTHQTRRVALVTGGSRGIGKATVLALATAGFDVAFSYASNQAAAQATIKEAQALHPNGRFEAIPSDVASSEQATALVDQVHKTFGRLDGLVNNAGITRDTLLIRMNDAQWDEVIQTNLSGVFYTSRAAAKVMMKQRAGTIINISSIVGVLGNAGQANYAAAKAGLIGFTKTLAKELGPRNVTANVVAPGFIETDMTHDLPHRDQLLQLIPLKRFGQAEDIAKTVVFLLTSGSYITGQVIQVDGGLVF
jgi:3-oxoacyl-[acyl-carrier protein] reductase